jgi:nucleotide-binding universal stress UspA family protein
MHTRTLVPLDGSATAEQVLPYVQLLAQRLPAPVELLRVVEHLPPEWMEWAIGAQPLQIAASMSSKAEEYVYSVAGSLSNEGLVASAFIHGGEAASTIIEEGEKEPGTLLAMCTHGRTGVNRWVLGSVTQKVISSTSVPLLLVRSHEPELTEQEVDLQTVIVPLDGSVVAEEVIPHVVTLARSLDLRVILVRVTLPIEDYYRSLGMPVAPSGDLSREIDTMTRKYFTQVEGKLRQEGIARVGVRILHGHPADAIIAFARETPNSLVAMTTHGRSGVGRWLFGSVASRIVNHCGDPVLLVRAKE